VLLRRSSELADALSELDAGVEVVLGSSHVHCELSNARLLASPEALHFGLECSALLVNAILFIRKQLDLRLSLSLHDTQLGSHRRGRSLEAVDHARFHVDVLVDFVVLFGQRFKASSSVVSCLKVVVMRGFKCLLNLFKALIESDACRMAK
jgi:hypothetical protein